MSLDGEPHEIPVPAQPPPLGPVTPAMVGHLKGTKPWVRLCSILGFIGTGLLVVIALAMPFVASLAPEFHALEGGLISILYLFLACVYFFPALFLFRYASAIGRLVATHEGAAMEEALSYQMRFWRIVGIVAVIMLFLYALAFMMMVALGVLGVLKS